MTVVYYTLQMIRGLSTDTKPTTELLIATRFGETDTGIWFSWNGSAWIREPTLNGSNFIPVSNLGTGTPTGSKFLRDDQSWQVPAGGGGEAFPVGSVFLAVVSTNPNTLLGYGTWSQIAQGQFLVGQKTTDTDFDVAEETGGAKTHTHAAHDAHTHVAGTLAGDTATGSRKGGTSGAATLTDSHGHTISGATGNPSASLTHDAPSHLPPYLVVYIWKRTA